MSQTGSGISRRPRSAHLNERDNFEAPSLVIWVVLLFLVASFARINLLMSLKIGTVTLIAIGVGMIVKRNWLWTRSHTGMVLFFLLAASSILYGYNNYSAYRLTLVYLPFIVVAIALAWIMAAPKGRKCLIGVWVLMLAYVAIYSIFHAGRGPGGYAGDENDMTLTAAMGLSFALFGLGSRHSMIKFGSSVLIVVFVTASVISLSRGGMIAMAAVGLYYFLSTKHKFRKGFVVVVVLLGTLSFAPEKYMSELKSIGGELTSDSAYSTGQIRLFMWAASINAFKDNPILGVGAGNYLHVVGKYQPTEGDWPSEFFRRDRTWQSAHSFYFQLLAEHGIVGIVIIGFLIMRFFKKLRRVVNENVQTDSKTAEVSGHLSRQLLALALMGSMIAFLTAGIFLSVLNYPHLFYLIGMGAGLEVATLRDSQREITDDTASRGRQEVGRARST